ncbi:MAG: Zn-dependent oligopeptidase [Bacteroidetes bacterium]|nr:MAG: Zn-dependent oligopeptidase [Bacteroidota bacterium]
MQLRIAVVFFLLAVSGSTVSAQNFPPRSTGHPLLPQWNEVFDFQRVSPETIESGAMYSENNVTQLIAAIQTIDDSKRTFANTMRPLDDLLNYLLKAQSVFELLTNTHTDKTIRDKSGEKLEKFNAMLDDINLNEALYNAVKAYASTAEAKSLTGERAFFLKKSLRDFERNGMALKPAERDSLKSLNKKLNELAVQFSKNISTDVTKLKMTEEEMDGLDEDYKLKRRAADGTYLLDLSNPTYGPFMSKGKNNEARKRLYIAKMNIGKGNDKLLVEILKLRTRKAQLLGYKTYSEYAVGDIMAQNTKNVIDFEAKLAADLRPKGQQDINELLKLKQRETGDGTAVVIYPYEAAYYSNMLLEEKYQVDPELVKEYFETQNVIKGIFTIYQQLYNVSFSEDKAPSIWFKGVQAFSVTDNATKQMIGYFYLDLYPRENKYNHAGCFSLTGSKTFEKGKQLRTAALVCNFPAPTAEKPSLLPHGTVATFLHEFGHLMHVMLSNTELASVSGTYVAVDFVEAPSQIMENWAWQKKVLTMFAKHYQTGEVIPGELIDKMIASKNMNSGLNALQQVFYGTLDFSLNNAEPLQSADQVVSKVAEFQNRITFYPYVEGTNFANSFGHLIGYGSRYYGYMWSSVYAQDMFSVFEKSDPLSPETGKRYREMVLGKGGSDDAILLVKNFLGREPDNKSFLKHLGLN